MEIHPLIQSGLIDPLLRSSRRRILDQVKEGIKVIDIASGTGALARDLSLRTRQITAVDNDESMIRFSRKKVNGTHSDKIRYEISDVRNMTKFASKSFDLATMSLALHQFNPQDWPALLEEIFRLSGELLLLDYSYPLPPGYKKYIVYVIERFAGLEHSRNFRSFMEEGGVLPIVEKNGLKCTYSERSGSGVFSLYKIERAQRGVQRGPGRTRRGPQRDIYGMY